MAFGLDSRMGEKLTTAFLGFMGILYGTLNVIGHHSMNACGVIALASHYAISEGKCMAIVDKFGGSGSGSEEHEVIFLLTMLVRFLGCAAVGIAVTGIYGAFFVPYEHRYPLILCHLVFEAMSLIASISHVVTPSFYMVPKTPMITGVVWSFLIMDIGLTLLSVPAFMQCREDACKNKKKN